ncbi:ABC transporter permease [Microbacterium insulae]
MRLAGFLLRKIGTAAITLLVVLLVVFLSLQLLPGGFAEIVLGPRASEQARQEAIERFGLDQPVLVQFGNWLLAALQGDLGVSLVSGRPVVDEIEVRLPPTLQLVIVALLIAVVAGIVLGLVAGLARHRAVRGSARLAGTLSLSLPDFVLGTLLLYLATVWGWGLTNRGYIPFWVDPAGALASVILPAITLGLGGVALVMRTLRDSLQSTLAQPFISTAVARGDSPSQIVRRHVLRNSAAPTVTVIALLIGGFLGGTVVVETLFSVPGIGYFFATSVRSRDFAVVQAIVLLSATVFIVANMIVDVVQVLLDPRRAERRDAA